MKHRLRCFAPADCFDIDDLSTEEDTRTRRITDEIEAKVLQSLTRRKLEIDKRKIRFKLLWIIYFQSAVHQVLQTYMKIDIHIDSY